eukprot:3617839-Rhodomonas_salina.3
MQSLSPAQNAIAATPNREVPAKLVRLPGRTGSARRRNEESPVCIALLKHLAQFLPRYLLHCLVDAGFGECGAVSAGLQQSNEGKATLKQDGVQSYH